MLSAVTGVGACRCLILLREVQRLVMSLALRNSSPKVSSVDDEMALLMMVEMVWMSQLLGGGRSCRPGSAPGIVGFLDRKKCPSAQLRNLAYDR